MKHRYSLLITPINIILDMICLNIAFIVSYFFRFDNIENILQYPYLILFLLINLFWIILVLIIRPYKTTRITSSISQNLTTLITIIILHAAITAFYWFAVQAYYYSRIQLLAVYPLFFALGFIWRVGFTWAIRQYRLQGFNNRKYVILGAGDLPSLIIKYYESHPELGYQYAGYFDEEVQKLPKWRGGYGNVYDFIKNNEIDFIYCYIPIMDNSLFNDLINNTRQMGCEVKLLMDFGGFISNRINIEYHDFIPVINVSSKTLREIKDQLFKRIFDIVFSSFALLLGSPLLLIIAIITKLSSYGPIFFKQERTGIWGEKFTIYKFRSMYVNSSQIHSKGKKDPRITPWGHFMRKSRLDELPQLFNVLRGEMSIVGPRPLANYDSKTLFENMPDEYKLLLSVKPGLTSIGQVYYGYASNEQEIIERAKEDLAYIPSFQQDIVLIFQTLRVMVQGRGK